MTIETLVDRARALASTGTRRLLGIAGAPGAGKSTLAEQLVARLDGAAVLVPMDGFHLADVELARLGRLDRKGAVDTFDGYGYLALSRRLRAPRAGETVYAPAFERTLEQPVAGSIAVSPTVPLVITEGNYLLLDQEPWTSVAKLLDETWWVEIEDEVRLERLVRRHIAFGKSPAAARRFVAESDEVNALLVAPGRSRADLVVSGSNHIVRHGKAD